jgi:hypothetical protein
MYAIRVEVMDEDVMLTCSLAAAEASPKCSSLSM